MSLLRTTALIAALLLILPVASMAFALPVPPQPSPDPTPGGGAGTNNGTNNGTGNQTSGGGNNSTSPPPSGLQVILSGPTVVVAGSSYTWDVYVGWDATGSPTNGTHDGNNTTSQGHDHLKTETVSLSASTNVWSTLSIPGSAVVTEGQWTHVRLQATFDVRATPGLGQMRVTAADADGQATGTAGFTVV